jgi:hypothetical protein
MTTRRKLLKNLILFSSISLCIWLIFFPNWHYYIAIGISFLFMPLFILSALVYKDNFEFIEDKPNPYLYDTFTNKRINLFDSFFFISFGLGLRALIEFQILNYSILCFWLFVATGSLSLLVWFLFKKKWELSTITAILIFYSFALVLHLNDLGSIPKETTDKGYVSHKFRQRGYHIVIGENNMENRVRISKSEYENYSLGMPACAKNTTGWLGITTRSLVVCSS